jgi:ABC-type transport system involved in multi-copper enzyme maturation permease subunit
LGPLALLELVWAARRRRFRLLLVGYATLLGGAMALNYVVALTVSTGRPALRLEALFAHSFFFTFTYLQLGAVSLATPAYLASVLAREKQRGTLELLLTTRLSDREIVVGRLAVPFLRVLFLVLAGIPLLTFAAMLGGIASSHIVFAGVLTVTQAVSLAGLSVLVSSSARLVRDAVVGTYVLALLVTVGLPAACTGLRAGLAPRLDGLSRVEDWLWQNPFSALTACLSLDSSEDAWSKAWPAVRNHLLWGVAAVSWGTWRLRGAFLGRRSRPEKPRRSRVGRRPALRDRPVAWLEMGRRSQGWLSRIGRGLIAIPALGLMVCSLVLAVVRAAALDDPAQTTGTLDAWRILLQAWGTPVATFLLLALAVRAATAISGEREASTLDPLLLTPLEPHEIVAGKLLGGLWSVRWLATPLVASWMIAAMFGAISVVSFGALLVELLLYGVFAAAVGLQCSLRSRASGRAVAWAVAVLFFSFGGFYLLIVPVCFGGLLFAASPPTVLALSVFAPLQISVYDRAWWTSGLVASFVAVETVVWLAIYTALCSWLVSNAVWQFDRRAGRMATNPGPVRLRRAKS